MSNNGGVPRTCQWEVSFSFELIWHLFTIVVEILFHIATFTLSLSGASHNIRIFSSSQLHFPPFPLFTCHTTAAIQLLSIPAPPQSLICGEEVCFCPNYATLFSVTSAQVTVEERPDLQKSTSRHFFTN